MFLQTMLHFWIITFFVLQRGEAARQHRAVSLTCECSTSQCLQRGTPLCTTQEGLCFTQYLERGPGSPPFIRGCTDGKTPLLCENRRPLLVKNWPLLHCCDVDLCNAGVIPTPTEGDDLVNNPGIAKDDESEEGLSEFENQSPQSSPPSLLSSVQKNPWPHIVSPVYVSVLILGIVSLIIIGIVAATVIRRNKRFYAEQYGALEFQQREKVANCDCDSELDSMGSSQPYLHFVCSNSRNV